MAQMRLYGTNTGDPEPGSNETDRANQPSQNEWRERTAFKARKHGKRGRVRGIRCEEGAFIQ